MLYTAAQTFYALWKMIKFPGWYDQSGSVEQWWTFNSSVHVPWGVA